MKPVYEGETGLFDMCLKIKSKFLILLGYFPNHSLLDVTFQIFVLREQGLVDLQWKPFAMGLGIIF